MRIQDTHVVFVAVVTFFIFLNNSPIVDVSGYSQFSIFVAASDESHNSTKDLIPSMVDFHQTILVRFAYNVLCMCRRVCMYV